MPRTGRSPGDDSRAPSKQVGTTTLTIDEFADTYDAARFWVEWNARRRWPDFPANDDVWAMSVAGCARRVRREVPDGCAPRVLARVPV
jgi:hypothetical protein